MNALAQNSFTQGWAAIGAAMPRPKGILCVSAHWYVPQTAVTIAAQPRTIHDFGGFPRELFEVRYPAPGDAALAERAAVLLDGTTVYRDAAWGLDHGAWSVLVHLFPGADIPVVQLSIDERQPAQAHYELGRRLAPLRDEGILIMGSGNVVHNLHAYAWGLHPAEPFEWATSFEQTVRDKTSQADDAPLVAYESLGRDAELSVPTPEHYLPLLYVLGARHRDDRVDFPVRGVDGGSISMLTVRLA